MQKSKAIKPAPAPAAPALVSVFSPSNPFIFDPTGKARVGDHVLIKRGQGFVVVAYDGAQQYLGTIDETELLDEEGADEDSAAPAPAGLANINDVYARVAAAFEELFAHPDCSDEVRHTLAAAQNEIINHANVLNDVSYARFFCAEAMAKLGAQEKSAD